MTTDTAIAIVGVGCRFPDADTPERFWANLDAGRVSVRELSEPELLAAGVGADALRRPGYVRKAATLAEPGHFAADFFGYPPTEAELIDPQQRLFLETCWEALERAGHLPRGDAPRIGVFAGSSPNGYTAALHRATRTGLDHLSLQLGTGADFIAARVAYKLGLRGPSVAVQTACSSSLTAVHYAVLSLLSGECDLALAGGAGVAEPAIGYQFQPGGILSDDGYCRAFDAGSSGTTVGSGVGVVVLRRLADAVADRDPVLAVICGSAVGNDGAARPGFTAPTPAGPADVVAAALHTAGVDADSLRYVEAHGSGTHLGDHVELRGLTDGLRGFTRRTGFCALGSVKVNIGHTGAAAGIAGLIKAVHVAHTGSLPPHPLFDRPRDPGMLADSPFHVPTERTATADAGRHVLVNSMGLGGTNAAVVLAAGPLPEPPTREPEVIRLHLSARNRTELDALSARLADEVDRHAPRDMAFTLRRGRRDFAERRVITAAPDRLAALLRLPRPGAVRTRRTTPSRPIVVAVADEQLMATVLAAFEWRAEVVDEPPARVPDDAFVVNLDGDLEEVLATAWLHGVAVDWSVLAEPGRRVTLPTYPFPRRRFWALDNLAEEAAPPATAVPSSLEESLLGVWRELFGEASIGLDDEFGTLGGTSLLSVRMALEVERRHGVLLNLHRAGGSRTTVRRIAGLLAAGEGEDNDGDATLIDADLRAGLGPVADVVAGNDVLLTGATGFLGAFLLDELCRQTPHRIHCLVRADDETHAWQRIRTTAQAYRLPPPNPDRVAMVTGDLPTGIGHVVHCAARVVFTEPYRVLRADNVTPLLGLLRWMRATGIGDLSLVSSLAATGPAATLLRVIS